MLKQKVILLIPNLDFGGAQKVFYDHSVMLAESFEVVECVFNLDFGRAYPSENRLVSLDVAGGKNIFEKIFFFVLRIYRLRKLLKSERPDLVISHLEGADYVNILAGGGIKKILVIHGSKLHDQNINNWLGIVRKKILIPILYERADKIVTVSEGIEKELVDSFKLSQDKVLAIQNFFSLVDLKKRAILSLPEEDTSLFHGKTLITSGRLVNQKNHEPLLHVIKYINDIASEPVRLMILGDGPLFTHLVEVCKRLSLKYLVRSDEMVVGEEYDIIFMGYQKNPLAYYKFADLFVFPSAWEGFPMALGEAMSLTIPVVSANCPTGPLELIEPDWRFKPIIKKYPYWGKNGVLLMVPQSNQRTDIQMWGDTILQILDNHELRTQMTLSANQRMMKLDISQVQQRWVDLIKGLLSK